MEINESPVVFKDVISKNKTARDFTEACACCLIPLAPSYSNRSLLLCEECEEKWREEKRPVVQDSDDPETPLSSANISLTLGDGGDTENCASGQLDKENDLERLFLRVENELTREELSRGMLNSNESRSRSRIIEIVKRVLKTCGYVVAAVIGVPLIAGAGAASIVVITIAGALSPPVILAIAKHRKLTSNQWWTYTRKERYFAIGWGVVVGTLMLPLLAPWGIYKLFKVLGTKLLHNTIYWMKLPDSRSRGFEEEETDESSRDWPMGSVDTHRDTALFVLDRKETSIDGCQSSADPDQIQTEPSRPIPSEAVGYNEGLPHEDSCYVKENFLDAQRAGIILGSIKEDDVELEDFKDSCHICRGTVWKPGHGRDALSDEENDDGRRDTQRLWARKAVSDTRFDIKIPDEDFKARELGNGLCVAHQKRDETKEAVNGEENPSLQVLSELRQWRLARESRNEDEPENDVLTKRLQDADQGEEISSTPQCKEIKDLPEKGPKKTKKRRKRRTDKQPARENLDDSSSESEANGSLRKEEKDKRRATSQLVPETTNTAEAANGETDLQAEKTTPRKSRKARQSAREMARDKRKTKTKKSKNHEETLPRGGKNKQEQKQTNAARRQIACRFGASSPKKDQPENTVCPKQKSHESQSKHPFTVSAKGVGVVMETKRRGKLERMNAFRIKMDGFKKLNPGVTGMSSTSSEQDIVALYDEID